MTATAAQIAQVRRMVAEPDATTYASFLIQNFIEAHPLRDECGNDPYTWDDSTTPPTKDENEDWVPTYDLNAAAADIWDEKAAWLAGKYDFAADGGTYHRSQAYEQAAKMARYYRSRRHPKTWKLTMEPKVETDLYDDSDLHN
jgi:hypothetical protein